MTVTTTWVDEGKILRVDEKITPEDILEFAEALIEEEGWRNTTPGADAGGGTTAPWTIHQAIGEAANRLNPESYSGKDSPRARPLRDAALELLQERTGKTDIQLNDECSSQAEAIEILRAAREGA